MTLALTITMTQAGQARFTAAQLGETIDLAISSVGLTDAVFVVAPTLTALPGEFRRLDTISGKAVGDQIVHLTMRDEEPIGYTARGFGLFLADGTLFAVYGQPDQLFEKSLLTTFLASIDIAFPSAAIDNLTFGNTDFLNPPATTTVPGVIELATQTETDAGTDTRRAVTPKTLAKRLADLLEPITKALATFIPLSQRGARGGVAQLDAAGTVPIAQLKVASYVDITNALDTTSVVTPAALGESTYLRLLDLGDNIAGSWRSTTDGMLESWGTFIVPADATSPVVTVGLPFAFPDLDYHVSLTPALTAAAADTVVSVQLIRNTRQTDSFEVQFKRTGTTPAGSDGFEWRAWRRHL